MAVPSGPLRGLVVFDLTRVLAGPTCTQMLGDLGAEVIKIERPGSGDDTRGFAPPVMPGTTESAYFVGVNRNKRSVTLDIGRPEGQAIARRLIAQSDILVENFKVGALARYGLDYATLHAAHPRLIYCSITGFGQTGPYAERPGYDSLMQAMGGVMSLTGEPDGLPQKVGVPVADLFAGLYGCIGILAALRHRDATGEGQQVDIGMLDAHVAWLANQGMNYLATGEDQPRLGNQHPNIVPYQVFATADGHVVLSIGNDATFARFVRGVRDRASARRRAVRDQCRAGGKSRAGDGDAGAGAGGAHDGGVGGEAGGAEDRLRPDQPAVAGVRRPAGAGARRRGRDAARSRRQREGDRQPGAAVGDAARLPHCSADARRAHGGGAVRALGLVSGRTVRAASRRRHLILRPLGKVLSPPGRGGLRSAGLGPPGPAGGSWRVEGRRPSPVL